MASSRKFTGKLAKPLEPFKVGPLADHVTFIAARDAYMAAIDEKMVLLRRAFNIEPGPFAWHLLAIRLAQEFVPGFKPSVPQGRPKKWEPITRAVLVVEIQREMSRTSTDSVIAAARSLAKRDPWKRFLEGDAWTEALDPNPGEALRKAYDAGKRDKLSAAAWDAFRYHKAAGDIEGWAAFVECCVIP